MSTIPEDEPITVAKLLRLVVRFYTGANQNLLGAGLTKKLFFGFLGKTELELNKQKGI